MLSYQYRDPHVKDKTVSYPYLSMTVFILRQGQGHILRAIQVNYMIYFVAGSAERQKYKLRF